MHRLQCLNLNWSRTTGLGRATNCTTKARGEFDPVSAKALSGIKCLIGLGKQICKILAAVPDELGDSKTHGYGDVVLANP